MACRVSLASEKDEEDSGSKEEQREVHSMPASLACVRERSGPVTRHILGSQLSVTGYYSGILRVAITCIALLS